MDWNYRAERRQKRRKRKKLRRKIGYLFLMAAFLACSMIVYHCQQPEETAYAEITKDGTEVQKKMQKDGQEKSQDEVQKEMQERVIDPEKPMVAITYDDGPGFEAEDRILDSLEQNDATATFFYLGCRVDGNEEKIKRAYDLGCEIGSHTWDHPVLTKLSEQELTKQMAPVNEAIKEACGAGPAVFRPSYGETNDAVNAASDLPVILWSIDTMDWHDRNGQRIFDQVTKEGNLDGKIILMHSIYDSTADATELLLPWLKAQGYQTVTVSELIRHRDGAAPQKGVVYQ